MSDSRERFELWAEGRLNDWDYAVAWRVWRARDDEIAALKVRVETFDLITEHLISVSADEEGVWSATVPRRWGSYRSATGATIHEAVREAVRNARHAGLLGDQHE